MAEQEQIIKALKNRVAGMLEDAKRRHRHGLKQQVEELQHLVEMLEAKLDA